MRFLAKFFMFLVLLWGMYQVRDVFIRSGVREKSLSYVVTIAGSISSHWNRAVLDRIADPNLAGVVGAMGKPHALDFPYYAQLGERTSEFDCKLADYTAFKDETRNYLAVNYECAAQFQRGPATLQINMMRNKETDPWSVGYFDVVSPVFANAEKK